MQSGRNHILSLMTKKYTIEEAIDVFYMIKSINFNIEISTQIVIKFP